MAIAQPEANQASFARTYAQMSDAELLKLQSDLKSLVEPAVIPLQQEIAKRHLIQHPNESEEIYSNGYITSPGSDSSHLPYRWGRFIGSLTAVSGILGAIVSAIHKDAYDVIASILYAMYGIGIYHKKKWAIFFLEVGSGVGLLVVVILFFRDGSAEALGGLIIILAFWLPQTVYFWKRRDEMS